MSEEQMTPEIYSSIYIITLYKSGGTIVEFCQTDSISRLVFDPEFVEQM